MARLFQESLAHYIEHFRATRPALSPWGAYSTTVYYPGPLKNHISSMTSIESIPEKWAAAWSDNDSASFAKLFAPQAVYTDHAHQLTTTKLEDHHRVWRNANPDFKVIVDPSTPIWWAGDSTGKDMKQTSCSFRTINTGTFMESLPRKVASGKDWSFTAMVHLVVEDGLITQLDEFYRDSFDEGVPVEKYIRRG